MPIKNVALGRDVRLIDESLINLYGCSIGDATTIGPFVEVQRDATIGERCKISSHTFVCEGVTIEDEVFIGHGVMFTNDRYPLATNEDGTLQSSSDWSVEPTKVGRRASIGSNATILSGIVIGGGALVGAGAVVTKDVPPFAIVAGAPARVIGDVRNAGNVPAPAERARDSGERVAGQHACGAEAALGSTRRRSSGPIGTQNLTP